MVSFVSYVLRFKKEDSAIGDVARDIEQDVRINRRWGHTKLVAHLLLVGAVDRIFGILAEANIAYVVHRMR